MEAAEQNRSFEDSGWRHRGSQGAAESSVESDAPSRDDGSMGSGESDAQVQHAQMRQGTAHGESESESEGSEAFNSAEVRRWPAPWGRRGRRVAESEDHDLDDSDESRDEEDGLEMQERIGMHKLCLEEAATDQARAMTAAATAMEVAATEQARAMTAAATATKMHTQAIVAAAGRGGVKMNSIMPGQTWRDNGHKALCPLSPVRQPTATRCCSARRRSAATGAPAATRTSGGDGAASG